MVQLKISGKGAFMHLFEPAAQGFNAGKFGVTICVPKDDNETVARFNAAQQQAITEKWGGNPPPNVKTPLKDGDAVSANKNFQGCFYFETHSKEPPVVVDRKKQPIRDGKEIPNGCECNFILTLKGYEVDGNVGITCYLNAVQYVRSGAWSNTNRVADLFDLL